MDAGTKEKFISAWQEYFPGAELPLAFWYSRSEDDIPAAEAPEGHRCLIAQLMAARHGKALRFEPSSISCGGGKRYLGYADSMRPGFACFLSHDQQGNGERYKSTPQLADEFITALPLLKSDGQNLIFKRWDILLESDEPDGVIFFATADTLSGLFTLARFDTNAPDAVIAPFGAGCTSIIYYPYMEQKNGTGRAVIGLLDPSARKCAKAGLLTMAVPMIKFRKMIDQMEESFLKTDTWNIIKKRIAKE